MYMYTQVTMKRVNALELRQSLGGVVDRLLRTGEPVLLERGRKPVAVLISLQDFRERFVEVAAAAERETLFDRMDALARPSADTTPAIDILRELRT